MLQVIREPADAVLSAYLYHTQASGFQLWEVLSGQGAEAFREAQMGYAWACTPEFCHPACRPACRPAHRRLCRRPGWKRRQWRRGPAGW